MTFRHVVIACCLLAPASLLAADETVDFVSDVYPIMETYCISCHSSDDPEGGLAMDDFKGLLRGGSTGPAITAGEPDSSRMLLMASGKLEPAMPPDGEQGPNEEELEILTRWIEQGAKGPDGDMPIRRELQTPKISPSVNANTPITAIAIAGDSDVTALAMFGRIEIRAGQSETVVIADKDLGKINSLAFTRDGTRLLVASGLTGSFGRAAIYSVANGELIREFVGHRDILYAAEFSPDETLIATAGYDRKIILWDSETGSQRHQMTGHNGAIFDLAFSPDGRVLVSACADETAKVWNVGNGSRLDTLSQPEGEVLAVEVTADGRHIVAASADNRIRVWRLKSLKTAEINPLVATRFLDETPIINFTISPDSQVLVAIAESGNIKIVRTTDWQPYDSLGNLGESGTDLFFSPDSRFVSVSLMNGTLARRKIPSPRKTDSADQAIPSHSPGIWMDLGEPRALRETDLDHPHQASGADPPTGHPIAKNIVDVDRNVVISGTLSEPNQADHYRWPAVQGEQWAIDADAITGSRIDPLVTILDESGKPVVRVRLQAVLDSYFTFRGKDSKQTNDFRVFNWQEMKLGEYLYAGGEVTRLARHPRGPDSGFDVYPGEGQRWTYFGTSGTTHALGEPAYIVRPLPPGSTPLANGLPVFDVICQNDDAPNRLAAKNSRLLFMAPRDGLFTVRVEDTRGEGGKDYAYELAIRAAVPGFTPANKQISKPLRPGTGREFQLSVDRQDGYSGPITFEIDGLPDRLSSNFPVTVEPGQRFATGMIWAAPDEQGWEGELEPKLNAWASISGKRVERMAGTVGKLKWDPNIPQVTPTIRPTSDTKEGTNNWTLRVRRGTTVSARVSIQRASGFKNEVSFGKEKSGRNASQGVYVDNIGLNGLLIVAGSDEREFFVTADSTATPGKRSFFLTAAVDGGLTSHAITIEVLP